MKLLMADLDSGLKIENVVDVLREERKKILDLFEDVEETSNINVPEKCYNADEKIYNTTCLLNSNQVDKEKFRLAIITKSDLLREWDKRRIAGRGLSEYGSSVSQFKLDYDRSIIDQGYERFKKHKNVDASKEKLKQAFDVFYFMAGVHTLGHEILHTLKLDHCKKKKCVMYDSLSNMDMEFCNYHDKKIKYLQKTMARTPYS